MEPVVNVLDFGVQTNSDNLQTRFFQDAIDFCYEQGGGKVVVPQGVYRCGDIRIRSGITLYLEKNAVIKGSRNPEDYFNYLHDRVQPLSKEQITDAMYVHLSTIKGETKYEEDKPEYRFKRIPGSRWNNAIIRAIDAENIKIIGEAGSQIDGDNCFDAIGEEDYRGPHGITLFNCKNIELEGYTIQNTGNWAHNLLFCDNIKVNNIKALAGHDGFDASVCTNLVILDSEFYTGDDCIAGFANVNVHIKNCILNSSCSAMRFGGTNVLVEKCTIYGPGEYTFRGAMPMEEREKCMSSYRGKGRTNMLSAFTYYADYSLSIDIVPGNIVITDSIIKCADKVVHYNYSGNETWQKNRPLDSIEFRNVRVDGISKPNVIYGDKKDRVKFRLIDATITIDERSKSMDVFHVANCEEFYLKNVTINNADGECLARGWSDIEVICDNVVIDEIKQTVKKADNDFAAAAI